MKASEIPVCKVKLNHYSDPIPDIPQRVRERFPHIRERIQPGMSIAVTVGSRGVSNIDIITKALVDCLKEAGAKPFIIPAMGSHGGANAQGQMEVLAGYNITEETMGVPIRSSMTVERIGTVTEPVEIPVYMDKNAWEADGVIAVNRVKVHTDFHGPHESGIVKMLTIGLGKHAQALAIHLYGTTGLREYIPLVSQKVIESGKILGALAILEDGYDQTTDLEFALPDEIFDLDSQFLERSRKIFAHLPFKEVDTMIVDCMGKDISGTGMDPNIIGRIRIRTEKDGAPACKRVAVLNLSSGSHGNGLGVGLADVTTKRLADQIDWETTYQNVITSGFNSRGFLPIVQPTDKRAVSVAIGTCGIPVTEDFRLIRIRDTLHLDTVYLSRSLWEEIEPMGTAERISDFAPIMYDASDNIEQF